MLEVQGRRKAGDGVFIQTTPSCVSCATSNYKLKLIWRLGPRRGQVTTVPSTHGVFNEDFLEEATFEQRGKQQVWTKREDEARRYRKLEGHQCKHGC